MLKAILGLTAAAFNINKFTTIMRKTYSVDSLERLENVWRLIRETLLKLKISSLKERRKLGIAFPKNEIVAFQSHFWSTLIQAFI